MNPKLSLLNKAAQSTLESSWNICWICDLPILFSSGKSHRRLSRTKDHVIPKSRKRKGDKAIIRYAHALCNELKSDNLEISESLVILCRERVENLMSLHDLHYCETCGKGKGH